MARPVVMSAALLLLSACATGSVGSTVAPVEPLPPPPPAATAPLPQPPSPPVAPAQVEPVATSPAIVPSERPPLPQLPQAPATVASDALVPLAFGARVFADLPNWDLVDVSAARRALVRSCSSWQRRAPGARLSNQAPYAGTVGDWASVCRSADNRELTDRAFWENLFIPWEIQAGDGQDGKLTAYYEPVMEVSRTKIRSVANAAR